MPEIAFSRPSGRVRVIYPEGMDLAELRRTLEVHLSVAQAALESCGKRDGEDT